MVNLYAGDPLGIDSTFVRAYVQDRPHERLELQVGVEYGRNPEFFDQVNLYGRATWRF